jgi:hypothetical protein
MSDFVKLSSLVGDRFTVKKVLGYKYKMWNDAEKRMVVSEVKQKGFRKLYQVETDKGLLDLGTGQMGNLLEPVFQDGLADINLRTFEVTSNGETGINIRYYFNPLPEVSPLQDKELNGNNEQEPNWEDIPF